MVGSFEEFVSCGVVVGKFDGFCDSIVESWGVGVFDGFNVSVVVEDFEGGYGGDVVCVGYIVLVVSVDFCECNFFGMRVFFCKVFVVRSNYFVWVVLVSIDWREVSLVSDDLMV